jgi:hypothetical protein
MAAIGWRTFLDYEDDGTETVEVLCPACVEREFGETPEVSGEVV